MKTFISTARFVILPIFLIGSIIALILIPSLFGDAVTFIFTGSLPHSSWSLSPTAMMVVWTIAACALIAWIIWSFQPKKPTPRASAVYYQTAKVTKKKTAARSRTVTRRPKS